MSISAMKQALEALEKLWDIIDDIDTYGDMAKSDDKLYRSLVERRQRQRFEQTGISTDGYELNGGAITALRQAIAEAEKQEQKTPLKVLGLTVFTENRLRNGRVYDVETLQAMTNRDILAIPGMGKKALKEVLEALDVYASDISQERVDETAKHRHEPVPNDYDRSIHSNPDAQAWAKFFMATVNEQEWCIDDIDESLMTGWFANAMMAMHDHVKREWVGLDGDIPGLGLVTEEFYNGMIFAEDILREKNT